ncbi:hypothetical protein A2962_00990 [Candidatus Woesebacteria bacterium RIFCSPLOWO2_01_FULL_39_61]|uniref:Metallo-beta-lactamase domain-containing protein n=1 Tax=Candidatus Woesebacteria bacterium RIFCSPHIGHO2_02_FULL_39_13 TaxID=1802505 RepID=A0A1F7YYE4_9BACT|nr:MAG: hypothetical protein A3D01_06600 [Candidatus Woesebacteria bacterium RIFCSPHIGHO2_02_FULL_39_13]OGM37069.1 MAG: hypothetical protein A3E13_00635 [Candidatus Woesebacteria bacterium RIFCSPHIGHO2_12_FULL_40_20]OGM65435.1 MAG: hypothetical protein A2962_00990 [Candidatus Woesebacteria bacterium RIFCSPLOWO2_01_FULL_39_61]OGM75200.1 MAG: hypothetical protein A3H19_06180 [Candidatus Woesebacteria bacterium RIFCSPLOWO2_12_FULL_39_9]
MKVMTLIVGQLKTNCYIIYDKKESDCIILDPGDDADYIIHVIDSHKLKPTKIIASHAHFDHILAALELQLAFNIPFLVNRKDEFLVTRMKSSAKHFLGIEVDDPPKINKYLKPLDKLKVGNYRLHIIATPGHTPGSVSIFEKNTNILFAGDLLFAEGSVGRSDFKYSDPEVLRVSLSKIMKLPKETIVYSGHGEPFTLKEFGKYWYN